MRLHIVTNNLDRDLLHVDTSDGLPREGKHIDIEGVHYPVTDVTWSSTRAGLALVLVEVLPATNTTTTLDEYLSG